MSEDTKIKVVIPPEVLAQMERDIPPEDLQELLEDLQRMVDSGEIFEQSEPVDMLGLEKDDPELFAQLNAAMKEQGFDNIDDWFDGAGSNPPTLN
jgi:hypothetical protein